MVDTNAYKFDFGKDKTLYVLKSEEFTKILADYIHVKISQENWPKIPYREYRKLMGYAGCEDQIIVMFDDEHNTIQVGPSTLEFSVDAEPPYVTLGMHDGAFGSYLLSKVRKDEGENPMVSNSYTTTTASNLSNTTSSSTWTTSVPYTNMETVYTPNTGYITINGIRLEAKGNNLYANNKKIVTEDDEKENKSMIKLDFGPATGAQMSMYGLAIKNAAGEWVSYDKDNHGIINVETLHINADKLIYKIPVAIDQIDIGDVVYHNKTLLIITDVFDDGTFLAVDPYAGEEKTIIPTRNMFGFNFMTKLVSIMDLGQAPDASNPFGNMLPFLLGDGADLDPMMLMFMNDSKGFDFSNPMMIYVLMKDGGNKDLLPFLLMSQNKA